VIFVGPIGLRYGYDALIAIGYGLMLPALAVLHVRHTAVRSSGAMLATVAGTATVIVGLAGSVALDLRPAALVVLGTWWWTMGKMWVQTAVMPRALGIATATLAVVALVGALALVVSTDLLVPGAVAAGQAWTIAQAVLGVWLLGLAAGLWGSTENGTA
jgi:hypothetical protein